MRTPSLLKRSKRQNKSKSNCFCDAASIILSNWGRFSLPLPDTVSTNSETICQPCFVAKARNWSSWLAVSCRSVLTLAYSATVFTNHLGNDCIINRPFVNTFFFVRKWMKLRKGFRHPLLTHEAEQRDGDLCWRRISEGSHDMPNHGMANFIERDQALLAG